MIVSFLICFPLIVSLLMYCIRVNKVRNAIAYVSAVIIMGAVALLVGEWVMNGCVPIKLFTETETVDKIIVAVEWLIVILVTYLSFKHKKAWVSLLSVVPTACLTYLDFNGPALVEQPHIYIDHMSVLMCIIIGLIGGLIVIYAVGYMHGYHHHHLEFEDRRYYFFMLLFVFLGAMFGFVLSDSTLWIDLFWEMTSICSFLLIGYTKTDEAITNSFRALWMNLLGGCALAAGIIYQAYFLDGNMSLQALIGSGVSGSKFAVVPVALISFAALTKAAQMPFAKWLMGAMVAPTPSSALLHSATMV
ncbi:MAG: NADH-quinone oxidoreductase subunit L, partial [Lachnospiraceae bacterium]|nr:NADH-quinone oxidoreductase subunit L [Lachnospiraceae bacterium]